jgi:hypothetical protein
MASGSPTHVLNAPKSRAAEFFRQRPQLVAVAVAMFCGTTYTASIVGVHALDPTNISWLRADALTEYLAWTFMRQDPVTALPLTFTDLVVLERP